MKSGQKQDEIDRCRGWLHPNQLHFRTWWDSGIKFRKMAPLARSHRCRTITAKELGIASETSNFITTARESVQQFRSPHHIPCTFLRLGRFGDLFHAPWSNSRNEIQPARKCLSFIIKVFRGARDCCPGNRVLAFCTRRTTCTT